MNTNVNPAGTTAFTTGMAQGIEVLLVAGRYAQDANRDCWDFAVELQSLQEAGMNCTELRWLVCKGFVQHAEEDVDATVPEREFREISETTFRERSCFVMTKEGVDAYEQFVPER